MDAAVRYLGFFAECSGYGEAARRHLVALAGAGAGVVARSLLYRGYRPYEAPVDGARFPEVAALARAGAAREATRVVHAPAPCFPSLLGFDGAARARVGVVAWELPRLPADWGAPLAAVDELWVPSAFCAEAVRAATERPVVVVPHPVAPPPATPGPRSLAGVPDDVFLFAAILEWCDRKNPLGLLRAFRDAFAGRRDVGLLLKVGTRHRVPPWAIERAVREPERPGAPPVYLMMADELPPAAIDAIHRRADGWVSLHRAEGFGLAVAEAMARGTPVVATGWSGNLEYMDAESALLVEARLVPVEQRLARVDGLEPTMRWAEPDHDAAVAALRRLVDEPALRSRLARAAVEQVRQRLDPARIGARMRARLDEQA